MSKSNETVLTTWLRYNDLPIDPQAARQELNKLRDNSIKYNMLYKEYAVTWQIEVTARNTREAAKKALEIMRDPESKAQFFEVTSKNDRVPTLIDLIEDEQE